MTSKEALSKLWIGCKGQAMIYEYNEVSNDLDILDLIINKQVDMWLIETSKSLDDYNEIYETQYQLTKLQYDLLKERIANEKY